MTTRFTFQVTVHVDHCFVVGIKMRARLWKELAGVFETRNFSNAIQLPLDRFSKCAVRRILNSSNDFISRRTDAMRLRLDDSSSSVIIKLDNHFLSDGFADSRMQFQFLLRLTQYCSSEN